MYSYLLDECRPRHHSPCHHSAVVFSLYAFFEESCTLHQIEQLLFVSQSHQNFLVCRKQISEVNCAGLYM